MLMSDDEREACAEQDRDTWIEERVAELLETPANLERLVDDWQVSDMPAFYQALAEALRTPSTLRTLFQKVAKDCAANEFDDRHLAAELEENARLNWADRQGDTFGEW